VVPSSVCFEFSRPVPAAEIEALYHGRRKAA
jgi:hypothetical protein